MNETKIYVYKYAHTQFIAINYFSHMTTHSTTVMSTILLSLLILLFVGLGTAVYMDMIPFLSEHGSRTGAEEAFSNPDDLIDSQLSIGPNDGSYCPQCSWECEPSTCPQICSSICEEPDCQIQCKPLSPPKCVVKCEPPKCRNVCPDDVKCVRGNCNLCRVECDEPQCRVECYTPKADCTTRCQPPKCERVCKEPDNCPPPKCKMVCDSTKREDKILESNLFAF